MKKIDNYYYIDGKNYDSFVFLRVIPKKEKEEYKNNINNKQLAINKNQCFLRQINNKINIIKIIILIICTFINILIDYKLNQKL